MNINYITSPAIMRIGSIVLRGNSSTSLCWDNYNDELPLAKNKNGKLSILTGKNYPEILLDNRGRVYFIVVNDIIVKIGGSGANGGLRGTFSFYMGGPNPYTTKGNSKRNFGCWNFMYHTLTQGNRVDVYCGFVDVPANLEMTIPTMSGEIKLPIKCDFKSIEKNLFEEYVSVEGRPPFLNIQEKGGLGNWEKTANQTCADVVIKEHLITDWPGM